MSTDINEITKYPILMVHGIGYRDRGKGYYWGRISDAYIKAGAAVYYGEQDAWGSIHNNALTLRETIDKIISESGSEKVNIIAHSKGGLEARYLATELGYADRIASITTISTPHRGSKVMNSAMGILRPLMWIAGFAVDVFFKAQGDSNPDFFQTCDQLTTKKMAEFNDNCPDDDRIYYQSYASVMKSPASDIIMAFQNAVVYLFERENDGLISPKSAEWGNFKGILRGNTRRGISHADVVDIRRKPFSQVEGEGVKDIVDEYIKILYDIKELGF